MKQSFKLKIVIGFGAIILTVAVLTIQTYLNSRRQIEAQSWINHTNQVLYSSQMLLTSLVDAETAYRGFVITGNDQSLEPLRRAGTLIQQEFNDLWRLTADNPRQQPRVRSLDSLVRLKLKWADSVVMAVNSGREQAMILISSLYGKNIMDRIRVVVTEFQETEKALLLLRTMENEEQITSFNRLFIGGQLVLTAIVVILLTMIFVNLNARRKAEADLQRVSAEIEDLYDNAPSGYYSIGTAGILRINNTLLRWIGYAREEVIGKFRFADFLSDTTRPAFELNFKERFDQFKKDGGARDLEFEFKRKDGSTFPVLLNSIAIVDDSGEFSRTRTSVIDYSEQKKAREKIVQLNSELEAFTYSVSHDLRAPLRSITGYAQILKEDYGERLDDEGRRLVSIVINNTVRMGQLIDDLLEFSRVGRKELVRVNVDTAMLVQSVLHDLKVERKVHVTCGELLPCRGDMNLLRQVWINLISNALKYSSKRERQVIAIRSYPEKDHCCYCVQDNGVGFDMKYQHKLFGVFQRLHKMTDFDGTGVGLALVKRIIDRHQGSVWAESTIDQGASFYFSLPH